MNVKALSILVLLIVTLSFSGVASAATQKVLVSEAYDEQVLVSEAYDEQVLVSEAWNETVKVADEFMQTIPYANQFFASEGDFLYEDWYNWIAAQITLDDGRSWAYGYITEVFKEVFHPAVTHEEQRLVSEGYTIHHEAITHEEQRLVEDAYDEVIDPVFEEQVVREVPQGYFNNWNEDAYKKAYDKADEYAQHQMDVHDYKSYFIKYVCDWGFRGHFVVFFVDDVMIEEGYTIHHPAVYETVTVVDMEAWDEVIDPVYETIIVVDREAYTDYQKIGYLVTGEMFQFHPAVFETIEHPAVFETVHHDAVYKTVHHDAVYKDVEVAEPNTIPMKETGMGMGALVIAVLIVLGGLILARRK